MRWYELKIGYRYTRGAKGNKNKFVSFSSLMSMLGVVVGVTSLIMTMSIMNGYKLNSINKLLEDQSHVTIYTNDEQPLEDLSEALSYLKERGDLSKVETGYLLSVGASFHNSVTGLLAKSVSSDYNPKLKPKSFNILVSDKWSVANNVKVGDKVTLTSIKQRNSTPAGDLPIKKIFTVSGTFPSNKFNTNMAYINHDDGKSFSKLTSANFIEVNIKDFWEAPIVKESLNNILKGNNSNLSITDWTDGSKRLLALLKIEKVLAIILLTLIIVVAAFNMISTMVMAVADKKGEIAILRTIGCRPKSIMAIFLFQGCFVGFVGTAIGTILGVLGAYYITEIIHFIDSAFNINFLADILREMSVSSVIIPEEVIAVVVISMLLTVLSAVYPSWMASRVNPAEALKHE